MRIQPTEQSETIRPTHKDRWYRSGRRATDIDRKNQVAAVGALTNHLVVDDYANGSPGIGSCNLSSKPTDAAFDQSYLSAQRSGRHTGAAPIAEVQRINICINGRSQSARQDRRGSATRTDRSSEIPQPG